MRLLQFLLGLALLPATPTFAQVAQAPAPAVQQKSPPAAEKKICRREEGVGSRLNRQICLTREQWTGKAKVETGDGGRDRDPSATEGEPR
jgi:hypothetical protein